MLDEYEDVNLEISLLKERSFGSKYRTDVVSFVVGSYGKVDSSVLISVGGVYGKRKGCPLGKDLFGSECRTEVAYSDVRSYWRVVGSKIEGS